MGIGFKCSKCGSSLEAETAIVGANLPCPNCGTPVSVPEAQLECGTMVGGFRIEEFLGKGAMGEVYRACQVSMQRDVALKILPSTVRADRDLARRFLHEVHTAARLDHTNIVTAHEAGEADGVLYMAMSYVDGETVEKSVEDRGPFSERDALTVVRKVAAALEYAWRKHGLLHRDIKPANIILDDEREPKLADMGVSKMRDEGKGMTITGAFVGTPNYISPEQASGAEDIDFRSDMYSLGITLYYMVTGRVPFAATNIYDILRKQIEEPLPDPRDTRSELSGACVGILESMTAKNPDDRYSDWGAMVSDALKAIKGQPIGVRRKRKKARPASRKPSGHAATSRRGHGHAHASHPPVRPHSHRPGTAASKRRSKKSGVPVVLVVLALLAVAALAAVLVLQQQWMQSRAGPHTALNEGASADQHALPPAPDPGDAETRAEPDRGRNEEEAWRERLDQAVAYAEAHLDDKEGIRQRFQAFPGSPRSDDAARQARRIRLLQRRAAREAFKDLRTMAQELADNGKPQAAHRLLTTYDGAWAAETQKARDLLAARFAPPPDEPGEARPATDPAPPAPDHAQIKRELEALGRAFCDALLEMDFEGAGKALREIDARPKAGRPTEWGAFVRRGAAVLDFPAVIRESFLRQRGEQVRIRLQTGPVDVLVHRVEEDRVMGERIVNATRYGTIKKPLSFSFDDLDVRETLRRLGRKDTAERNIMRGLVLVGAGSPDKAKEFFERADCPLATALDTRMTRRQEERIQAERERRTRAAEEAASALCDRLHRLAGIRDPARDVSERVAFLRRRAFPAKTVEALRGVAEELLAEHADTGAVAKHRPLLETIPLLRAEAPLEIPPARLAKAIAQLKQDNDKEFIDREFESTRQGVVLDLTNLRNLTDLSALEKLPLHSLVLRGTGVRDLSPLRHMPLRRLDLTDTPVEDLGPLADTPLESLSLRHSDGGDVGVLSDLSPLKGVPIKELELVRCGPLRDLSALRHMPLQKLHIEGIKDGPYLDRRQMPVDDLRPLEDAPLKTLILRSLRVSDIEPLRNMPLQNLVIIRCPVENIAPLEGKTLRTFVIKETNVTDFGPLNDMTVRNLERE